METPDPSDLRNLLLVQRTLPRADSLQLPLRNKSRSSTSLWKRIRRWPAKHRPYPSSSAAHNADQAHDADANQSDHADSREKHVAVSEHAARPVAGSVPTAGLHFRQGDHGRRNGSPRVGPDTARLPRDAAHYSFHQPEGQLQRRPE